MDEISKYRLTGAVIWLSLLIIIVPGWYSNPVNFQPQGQPVDRVEEKPAIVKQPYVLPSQKNDSADKPAPPAGAELTKVTKSEPGQAQETSEPLKTKPVGPVVAPESKVRKGDWLVRVSAYREIRKANDDLAKLEGDYPVWIKEFSKSGVFSVRTGPYKRKSQAEADKRKIDQALHTQAKLVQVK